MALVAEVIDGSQKGTVFFLTAGKSFGRKKADYVLKDANVSGTHCKVELERGGSLVLVDLDSANGVLVNSVKLKRVKLIAGVTFILGDTALRVKEVADEFIETLPTNKKWRELLHEYVQENHPTRRVEPVQMLRFVPMLELEFVQGLQVEEKRTLSFGPRSAGFGHLDIDVQDNDCPFYAFDIIPLDPVGAQIVNKSGFKVLLNKKPVDQQELKNGDLIHVGRTVIKVSFL